MVQRDPSPRGDKNGADINLALDALEMAFTHDHIHAYAIVSGDSDFIALVNKLKQYNKMIFVVGGRAFTSTILQKNCHEFISYESLLVEAPRAGVRARRAAPRITDSRKARVAVTAEIGGPRRSTWCCRCRWWSAPCKCSNAAKCPQLGLLKSTMLQLDSTFNEKRIGPALQRFCGRLKRSGMVNVTGEGRYMIPQDSSSNRKSNPSRKGRSDSARCSGIASTGMTRAAPMKRWWNGSGPNSPISTGRATDFRSSVIPELRAG
jgi:hypothetical protein